MHTMEQRNDRTNITQTTCFILHYTHTHLLTFYSSQFIPIINVKQRNQCTFYTSNERIGKQNVHKEKKHTKRDEVKYTRKTKK